MSNATSGPMTGTSQGSPVRPRLHLRGHLLDGSGDDGLRDLWISDGVLREAPVPDAVTLCEQGWILPGFVDAHCHIGLGAGGAVSAAEAEAQAVTDRDGGTLLIRDAGSPSDTRWVDDRDDLPTVIRAGRHIARPKRYIRNFADEVEPEDLVASVEAQIAKGDGWVKLVGDWIDRSEADLAPLWPVDVARAAIERAHELGARVTAHCFAEQSAAELVAAGIDGIEHGTGLADDVLEVMAERQVALVPTMVNLENFELFARQGEAKFPTYSAHMRALYQRREHVVRTAFELGVPVFAGTDAGGTVPHGLIGTEISLLAQVTTAEHALGAASWRARRWLGKPLVEVGQSADLVVFDEDPCTNPEVTKHPRFVVLRGRVYGPQTPPLGETETHSHGPFGMHSHGPFGMHSHGHTHQ